MKKKSLTIILTTLSTLILAALILVIIYFAKFYPPVRVGGEISFVDGTYAAYNISGLDGHPDLDSFSFTLEHLDEYDQGDPEMIGPIKATIDIISGGQKIAVTTHGGGTAKSILANGKSGSRWHIGYIVDGEEDTFYNISCNVIGEDRDSITGLETTVTKQVIYGEPDEHNIRPSKVTTIYSFTLDKIA